MNEQEMHFEAAVKATLEAGKAIQEVYHSPDFDIQVKKDKSPLTKADRKAHEIIVSGLGQTGIPILSEEGKHLEYAERKKWGRFWLVDPLDGTKEFIKKNGEFTVNIALVEDGTPVMGIIYAPVLNTLYFAMKGEGAYKLELQDYHDKVFSYEALRKRAQKLPVKQERKQYTVVASRSHMSDETMEFIEKLKKEHGELDFISRGSSLKLCMVAEGKADVYPRFGPTMEWDTGAGHAIALESGCQVTLDDGVSNLQYNKENLLNPYFLVRLAGP